MFYDANDVQLSSKTEVVTSEDTAKKYESWGWKVLTIDGHDGGEIRNALNIAQAELERPTLIIGKTVMGKGVKNDRGDAYEGKVSMHGKPISKAGGSVKETIEALGGDPNNPFHFFPEVKAYYDEALHKKREIVNARKAEEKQWEQSNPELAAKLRRFLTNEIPEIDYRKIEQKANSATRNASADVLSYYADHIENMIVCSADLSNSDKTDGFLKKTTSFTKGNFEGAFIQAGVSELSMAAICNGLALHGGVIPVCATFFVFSDFMKPAIRLAALMELPVKYIWTHDAFRVGEDGPTHQPIEQEAQIRLLEQLNNHSGKKSFLALRPADAHETTICWKLALENWDCPSGLILSRQDIPDVPALAGSTRFEDAHQAAKGAYTVVESGDTPDIVLVGNGSEVSTLVAGAQKLTEEKGLKVRVVSAPSEGLFREQSPDYQQAVIPHHLPAMGLTAGLPVTLQGLVGPRGKVIGMQHFGYSAPYQVLDEKFGYTAKNVFDKALSYLEEWKA